MAFPRMIRPLAPALGLGLVLLLAGCGQPAAAGEATGTMDMPMPTGAPAIVATPVATTSVQIKGFAFAPQVITVPVGTTVTWTNQGVEEHTATALDKSFDSDVIGNGKSFSFTFTQAGIYDYHCVIHPNMVARVIVH